MYRPSIPTDLAYRPGIPSDLPYRPSIPSHRPSVPTDLAYRPSIPSHRPSTGPQKYVTVFSDAAGLALKQKNRTEIEETDNLKPNNFLF